MLDRPDIPKLRDKFYRIDVKNKDQLREWFLSQPHLTINDHAQICGLSTKTIRKYKKSVGIIGIKPKHIPLYPHPPKVYVFDTPAPENWRSDAEWLSKTIAKYGPTFTYKALQVNPTTLIKYYKKLNLDVKLTSRMTNVSKHPYCTKEWCYHHYITLGLSAYKCSKLAKINPQCFADWLNRFDIPVRQKKYLKGSPRTTQKVILLWCRELYYKLEKLDIVCDIYPRNGYIHVRYRNYFWENYYFDDKLIKVKRPYTYFHINENNAKIIRIPEIYNEYESDLNSNKNGYDVNIAINRKEIRQSTLIERRIALHRFLKIVISRGWVQPSFPNNVLITDMQNVINAPLHKYQIGDIFTTIVSHSGGAGRRIMLHFFDSSKLWLTLSSPRRTIHHLNNLLNEPRKKFNYFNLLLSLANNRLHNISKNNILKITDPIVYRAIFKKLNITGTIMDLKVGMGSRVVACASLGIKYTTPDESITHAIDNGICEITGLNYEPYIGQNVDVIIYDEGFVRPIMSKVVPYIQKCKRLLVFVPHNCRREITKYKPKSIIKIKTNFDINKCDYIFIF